MRICSGRESSSGYKRVPLGNHKRLSRKAGRIFTGPNDLWLSAASIWEIIAKAQRGRLPLPSPAGPYVVKKLAENSIKWVAVKLDHILRLESLPLLPKDPFDRILIAQSIEEQLPLITADPLF